MWRTLERVVVEGEDRRREADAEEGTNNLNGEQGLRRRQGVVTRPEILQS